MLETVISKPLFRVLTDLTQENRLEVALPLAIKDLLRLKRKESREQAAVFEQRYGMDFSTFRQAWNEDKSLKSTHTRWNGIIGSGKQQ